MNLDIIDIRLKEESIRRKETPSSGFNTGWNLFTSNKLDIKLFLRKQIVGNLIEFATFLQSKSISKLWSHLNS